MKLIPTGEWKG